MSDSAHGEPNLDLSAKIRADVPHSARIWNYWLGGKDYYPVDREAGEAWKRLNPQIVPLARQCRQFLIRVVRFLAGEAGIRQFLDIGTGLPTMQNTHEVAQALAPESRIVYVDNDPLVLAHARALLTNTTPEGVTTYIDADFDKPELIISDARNVLNFTEPIAVMFMGVLGHVEDLEQARSIVSHVLDAVPSDSYLALYDGTNTSEAAVQASAAYVQTGAIPYWLRSPQQIALFFSGLEFVSPAVVPVSQWRPDPAHIGTPPAPVDAYGAIAWKPRRPVLAEPGSVDG